MKAGAYKTARKYFFYQTCSSDTCQKTIFRVISLHPTAQQWYPALLESVPCHSLGHVRNWEFAAMRFAQDFPGFCTGCTFVLHSKNPFSPKQAWTLATLAPGYTGREPALSNTAPRARRGYLHLSTIKIKFLGRSSYVTTAQLPQVANGYRIRKCRSRILPLSHKDYWTTLTLTVSS